MDFRNGEIDKSDCQNFNHFYQTSKFEYIIQIGLFIPFSLSSSQPRHLTMDCIFSCETLDRSYPANKNDTNKSAEHDIFDRFRNQRVKVHHRYHYYS